MDTDFSGRKVVAFDVETTGFLESDPDVIEYAGVILDTDAHVSGFFLHKDPTRVDYNSFEARCKTNKPITLGALATHNIIPADLNDADEPFVFVRDVTEKCVLVGHCIDFDFQASKAPNDTPRICTEAIARQVFPGLDCYKLTALVYHISGTNFATQTMVRQAHGAGPDVMMTCSVLFEMLKRMPHIRSWRQLWDYSESVRMVDFGKYEGQPYSALMTDKGYRRWINGHIDRADPAKRFFWERYDRAHAIAKSQGTLDDEVR